jgi:putative sigma-54 modulation protein
MQLELTGRHLDVTPALRRLVSTKINKLERLLNDSALSAHVVLAREKHRHLTEINLHARGEKFLHALGDDANWEASLAEALDKLGQQVQKVKGRWQQRKRRAGKRARFGGLEQPVAVGVAPAGRTERLRLRMPRIVRASRQPLKPMSVADAARSIDGRREGIVVFRDIETAAVSVLFRRQNGELSLVEIEL